MAITNGDNELDQLYGELAKKKEAIGLLELKFKSAQLEREKLLEELKELILAGEHSSNRFRDFTFVKLGQVNEPLLNWLAELDGNVAAHQGQLALVVMRELYHTPPTGGVILGGSWHSEPSKPSPALRQTICLGVLSGQQLILGYQPPFRCALPFRMFIKRRSLMCYDGTEIKHFEPEISVGEYELELNEQLDETWKSWRELFGASSSSVVEPEIIIGDKGVTIGDEAVRQWMLKHKLHDEGGAIPSQFRRMCGQLGYLPVALKYQESGKEV